MSRDGDSDSAQDGGLPPTKRLKMEHDGPHQSQAQEKQQGSQDSPTEAGGPSEDYTTSNDKYSDFVTPEEVEKLREFRVLDEVKSNDEDSNGDCDDSESSSGESVDLPEEEIERMLEEDLPADFKAAPKPKEKAYVTREKVILEEKGVNHFEVLPLDWIMIRHQSGMPVYVHRTTRVCTLSKPYFLGKGNAKRHDIPISAIPCLAYRRALEEEERQKLIDMKVEEQIKLGTWNNKENHKKTDQENQRNASVNTLVEENASNIESNKDIPIIVNTESQCPYRGGSVNKRRKKVCPVSNSNVTNGETCNDSQVVANTQDNVDLVNATASSIQVDQADVKDGNNAGALDENAIEDQQSTIDSENGKKNDSETCNLNGVDQETDTKLGTAENITMASIDTIEIPENRQPIVLPGGIVMPSPRVETVNTSWKTQHLTHDQVTAYCKKLFKFRIVNIMHFKRWADRRKYTKARKALQYPMLPEGTKLITIPVQATSGQDNGAGKTTKRDWVMNMNGRSYLSVFHEYVRRALQKQPVYEFKQLENASTPYQATVYIGGMRYGVGHGSSKRQAKSAAARESIHILIPEMRDHLEPDNDAEPDFVFFDYVGIEDPRITEFCAATCEPTPHAILRTCLLRNFGAGDRHIHTEMKKLEYQKIELTMKVGKHSATVVCKNKKAAKQRASQAILQALHPHVRSWGSLLRLYGSRSVKSCKEKKLEEQQITLLQDKARHNEPNYAVLEKLRHEMRKLRERDAAVVPIGTLLLAADLPTHSGSNLNNVDL